MCSKTTKLFLYKCHGLFFNPPVMITVKSCLKKWSIKYYICLNHCHGLWRTTVTWVTLAIKTCLKTCLPHVHLQQITVLRGYIHPSEQPVVFILLMFCPFAAHWWFYIYRACVVTSIGMFITLEKCNGYKTTGPWRRFLLLNSNGVQYKLDVISMCWGREFQSPILKN